MFGSGEQPRIKCQADENQKSLTCTIEMEDGSRSTVSLQKDAESGRTKFIPIDGTPKGIALLKQELQRIGAKVD